MMVVTKPLLVSVGPALVAVPLQPLVQLVSALPAFFDPASGTSIVTRIKIDQFIPFLGQPTMTSGTLPLAVAVVADLENAGA